MPSKTYGEMDSKVKAKWVQTLESDKYEQGDHKLRTLDETYCCLGVLCDIVNSNKWVKSDTSYCYDGAWYGELPTKLRNKLEISDKAQSRLIQMNDSGKSFKQIATWIKRYL